jgi:hypothetical protein
MPTKEDLANMTATEAAAATPEQDSSVEVSEITETLKMPLTDADYKEYAIKIGQVSTEISAAEDQLASVKSQFKARIDAGIAKRNEYSAIINAGCVYGPVDCHLVKDFRENTVTIVRLDTREIVSTRTMSASERQRWLDFQDAEAPDFIATPNE